MSNFSLIIFTCSDDGTVNRLEPLLDVQYVRVNLDKPETWSFEGGLESWTLSSSVKTIDNSTNAYVWWWKAFLDDFPLDDFVKAELQYIARELYHEFVSKGLFVGNDFLHHEYRGKRHYLKSANAFLRVPKSLISQNGQARLDSDDIIVKSLASSPFSSKKVLYTTRVSQSRLDFHHPWFIQEFIEASYDVTIQIVGAELFAFERVRVPGQTVDWRKEQNYSTKVREWNPISLNQNQLIQIKNFLRTENLTWGRIDLLKTNADELVFLEFNANGQFGFLDPLNELGLFSSVAKYLSNEQNLVHSSQGKSSIIGTTRLGI